jgi:hypothetical protein
MDLTEFIYRAKKWYDLYPGVIRPVSGAFLHDHYDRRASARGAARRALDSVAGLGFRAWLPFRARAVQRKFGFDAAWRRRALAIARERFADPNDIALFRIERADQLDGYIRRFEDAALNKRINPLGWRRDCVLMDKVAFYRRCATAGLPHPEVAAILRDGAVEVVGALDGPLLLKPARGEGGRGVAFVEVTDEAALHRLARGRRGTWIVQRRLSSYRALRPLALGALSTARITTILNEAGVPEPVSAVLRLASDPMAEVDNMKAGGLLAPIDLATGALGIACKGYGGGDHDVHPVTGAAIPGFVVPDWEAAKALAVRAHADAFGDYALIGWDVGLTDDGPMLVEGNAKPGVLMPQRAGRSGLGGQRYGALLRFQLARAAATKV